MFIVRAGGLCAAVIRVFWTRRGGGGGGGGCPIINPLPVAPRVQMVPAAHMASNPVIGILFSEPPPSRLEPPEINNQRVGYLPELLKFF